jgi:GNAT superfamily N-acetyltransferase
MACANVNLVRSIYADWERGDFSRTEWADATIELVIADGPEPGTWSGLAGMAEFVREVLSFMEDRRDEAEDYPELADGRVFVLDRFSGRGRTSGLELAGGGSGGSACGRRSRRQGDQDRSLHRP